LDQVILASNEIGHLVSNVVVMGMGEPLLNFDNVAAALVMLSSKDGLGLGVRHVTVSTSGIPEGIRRLADTGYPWNLAVSLHAATEDQRSKLIPPRHRAPLEDILAAMEHHSEVTHRMPTLEIVLVNGVNDSPEDAARLANIAHRVHAKVNLIPCNNDSGPYQAPPPEKCNMFLRHLISRKIQATLRLRKGKGIDAACGQLHSKSTQPPDTEELP
jgi:23S rRNA (adenine2503-C2)-methyltransferase